MYMPRQGRSRSGDPTSQIVKTEKFGRKIKQCPKERETHVHNQDSTITII